MRHAGRSDARGIQNMYFEEAKKRLEEDKQ